MFEMIIKGPEYFDYRYFYRFTLGKLMDFAEVENDEELVFDLQSTLHMTPSVVCDLLSFFTYLKQKKEANVFLLFGNAKRLATYLIDSQFFLYNDFGELFNSDIISYTNSNQKTLNTDYIGRIRIPHNAEPDLPLSVTSEIQQRI